MSYLITGDLELLDLMNKIVSAIPAKWRDVGIQLSLSPSTLDGTQSENGSNPRACLRSFEKVLTEWKQQHPKPYTWGTIIGILRTPSVGEIALAEALCIKH